MWCPVCKKVLGVKWFGPMEIHFCSECRGLWLQKDQLVKAAGVLGAIDWSADAESVLHLHRQALPAGGYWCRQCDRKMEGFNYAYDSGVMLHRCDQCRSIWVDMGDMVRIGCHLQESVPQPGDELLATSCSERWYEPTCQDDKDALDMLKGIGVEIGFEVLLEMLFS